MEASVPTTLTAIGLCLGVIILVLFMRRRHQADSVNRVLAAHGAARCQAALALLSRLTSQPEIASAWEAIELPLLESLPDCPQPLKPDLAAALDTCAAACSRRDLCKRIMTMRNSIIA